jgi:hypothetical protein
MFYKEIRDQKTVIFCLWKKIAFSKHIRHGVQDLDQFVELPRALCNADGLPETHDHHSMTVTLNMDCFTYPKCFICGNWTSINDKHSINNKTGIYRLDGLR